MAAKAITPLYVCYISILGKHEIFEQNTQVQMMVSLA